MLVAKLGMTMSNMRVREKEKENVRKKEKGRERREKDRVCEERTTNFREESREYKLKEHRSVRRTDNALGCTSKFIFSPFNLYLLLSFNGSLEVEFSAFSRAYFIFALNIVSKLINAIMAVR